MNTNSEADMSTIPSIRPAAAGTSAVGAVSRRLIKAIGPVAKPLAGHRFFPLWAVLHHHGRVSGREYAIPIVAVRSGDGFVIPMPFGSAQWPQNVLAEGGATVHWKGRDYIASDPVVLGAEGGEAFNAVERGGLKLFGIHRFMQLRVAEFARA
jgi:hypothetical protein